MEVNVKLNKTSWFFS